MAEASVVYRPRHPERTPFYQLFERHFDRYLGEYEERFEPRYGYLRPVVARTVSAFLECGRLQSGFARIRCQKCRGDHLLAFSCQTRNFCPSCQAKRAALVAEKLSADVLAPVPHRHLIFTIPKVLRGLTRDGQFLDLPRWTPQVVEELFRRLVLKRLVALRVRGARRAGGVAR